MQRWDVPSATSSPSSDMCMVVNRGCNKTRSTGTSASVRKKFQCTPYSVTCSFIHLISDFSRKGGGNQDPPGTAYL